MNRPQVLVFIDWFSPGFKAGGPVRSVVNLVDHLRERIDFHIVTSDTEYTETSPYTGIIPDSWTVMPGGERVWYASRKGTRRSTWDQLIKDRAWDAVYVQGMWSLWFSAMPLWLTRGSDRNRIVAVRGMLAPGMMRHGGLKKRFFLWFMKLTGSYAQVEFQATNAEEVEDVKRWISPRTPIHQVPNLGRRFRGLPSRPRSKMPGELRLVSVARIALEKNTRFAIECLGGLTGHITFDLYGPIYDQDYWRHCQKIISALPPNVNVSYKGVIPPEEVPAVLSTYHALFMPSKGENFGHTMAEALANGLPLVISDRTPWRSLQQQHAGWDLPLDTPDRFTRALGQLLDADQQHYDLWCEGAFALGERYLNDQDNVERSFLMFHP